MSVLLPWEAPKFSPVIVICAPSAAGCGEMLVICGWIVKFRDVDENRIRVQVIHPGQGITLNTDELLLNDLGLPFEAILMVLDRNESEVEDRDRV